MTAPSRLSSSPVSSSVVATSPDMHAVMTALVRVRRRLRLVAALRGLGEAALLAAGMLLAWTALDRLGVLARSGISLWAGRRGALVCAGLLLLAGILRRALGRLPLRQVAHRIDVSHCLADRLGTALELSATPPGTSGMGMGMVQCALGDAARVATGVIPGRAAPLHWPPYLRWTGLLLAAAMLMALLPRPAPASQSRQAPEPPRLAVASELLEPDREAARELGRRAAAAQDTETEEVATELERLIAQLERGELSRKEFFDRLAALEQRTLGAETGELAALRQKLRKAGHELSQHRLTQKTGQALGQDQLAAAGQELSNLGRELGRRSPPLDEKTQRELGRTLERAAREAGSPPPASPRPEPPPATAPRSPQETPPAAVPPAQESPRRLAREPAPQTPPPPQLGNPQTDPAGRPGRQLERLQRELNSAGSQLSQGRGGSENTGQEQAAQSLRQAGETLRQMQEQLDRGAAARAAMSDLKELARRQGATQQGPNPQAGERQAAGQKQAGERSGQDPSGERQASSSPGERPDKDQAGERQRQAGGAPAGGEMPQPGRSGRQGQPGQEQTAAQAGGEKTPGDGTSQGRSGTGQGEGQSQAERLRDFFRRAQGQAGGKEPGPSPPPTTPDPGALGQGGDEKTPPGSDSGPPGGPGRPGPSTVPTGDNRPGDTHDPHLLGDPTRIAAHHVTRQLRGAQGSGPSRSATILGASERGFATTAYRRVYGDYTSVTEEVMSKERVPPGYRYYIKRYFQLIKPRE